MNKIKNGCENKTISSVKLLRIKKKSTVCNILIISFAFCRYAVEGLVKDLVEDLVGEDEDNLRLSKRQQLDDYGHMRFGKRSNNEDEEYGHLRFGKNIEK